MRFEQTLLSNLVSHEDFTRKVIPHLKEEYFKEYSDKKIFGLIESFISKYNVVPSKEALSIELGNVNGMKEVEYEECLRKVGELYSTQPEQNVEWLVEKTEKWCQDSAIYNSILKSVQIIDGSDTELDKGVIPKILSDALSVSFDTSIGHNLFDDFESRYEYYHREEERIRFDLSWLNEVTCGGLPKKTLNCVLAPPNAGKSLLMCSLAAHYMRLGKNVLYITMEMAEERIAERIDCNLMMMSNNDIKGLSKEEFTRRIKNVRMKTPGGLVIKEYPTAGAHAGHFRHLINELRLKKKYKVDVVFVDYMNICLSQRVKNANANSYTVVKSISEELRGLATEQNVLMWSATQTGRQGIGSSEVDMSDISESIGVAATCDFILAWIRTAELDESDTPGMGSAMLKIVKSRFGSTTCNLRHIVGVNYNTMTVYDLDNGSVSDTGYVVKKTSEETVFSKIPDPTVHFEEKRKDFGSIKF